MASRISLRCQSLIHLFSLSAHFVILSYWGQDGANSQKRLSFYCNDDTIDVIPLAFLYIFRGTGGDPVIDFANVSVL